MLQGCYKCYRSYCIDCTQMADCHICEFSYCQDCYEDECHKCNAKICPNCVEERNYCYQCKECDDIFSSDCSDNYDFDCSQCHGKRCDECCLRSYRQGQQDCAECIKTIIAPLLVDEDKRLHLEVDRMRAEIKDLKLRK